MAQEVSIAGRTARIGKRIVDEALPIEGGDLFIRDSDLKGFGLFVTPSEGKSYFLEYRMGGREPLRAASRSESTEPVDSRHGA